MIATLGRLDRLRDTGQLDALLESGGRFSESVMVLAAHRAGEVPAIQNWRIGPGLVLGRLWEALPFPQVIGQLLASGSDRSCLLVWRKRYQIPGVGLLGLDQMYRSMGWLGERLPEEEGRNWPRMATAKTIVRIANR